jgi:hypothetical protein
MSSTSFAGRLARAVWLSLLFVTTLEVCTRLEAWWRWAAPLWGPYSEDTLRITDEIRAHNRPGARFEKWVINSAGFRGPDLSLRRRRGSFAWVWPAPRRCSACTRVPTGT